MEEIRLDLVPKGITPICHASQYDAGRQIRFYLWNGNTYFQLRSATHTVTLEVKKPDNNIVTASVSFTDYATYVDISTTQQMCAVAGDNLCELKISDGTNDIGTMNFIMRVEEDPLAGGLESESVIHNLETMVADDVAEIMDDNYYTKDETDALLDLKLDATDFYACLPTETIQNTPIASFSDGADNVPVSELIVDINAVQDLHGYNQPWIGGAGKNLLNYDVWKTSTIIKGTAIWENNGVTITATGNDCYTSYTSPYFEAFISVSEGDEIWISWEEATNTAGNVVLFTSRNGALGVRVFVNNATAKIIHYTVTAEDEGYITWRFGVSNSGDTISYKNIQIEKGSSATAWSPYENIGEISGWNGCDISRCGTNIWNEEWELGNINDDGEPTTFQYRIRSKNYIPCIPSTVYYFKGAQIARLFYYDKNHNFISLKVDPNNSTFTTPSNCYFLKFRSSDSVTTYNNDISINYPSTDHDYHAFNGGTDTISLGDTYYGGTLNVTTGELTVTSGYIASYNGEAINEPWISSIDEYVPNTSPSTGAEVVYTLSTPTTVQLTPTEVRTLLDDNNIFADTGDVVSCKYRADLGAYIAEKGAAPIEVTGTLTAGQTSITLSNSAITSNSTIDIYTDADVDYISASVSTGSVTITFDAQSSNLNVKARIS